MGPKAMARQDEFLKPLLDLMQRNAERQDKQLDELTRKIDANTAISQQALEESKATNGRINAVEGRLRKVETKKGKKLELNPNVIYLIALGAVILLIIVASLLKVDLGGLVK